MADEVLLEKHYVEVCPGCKVDMRKLSNSGFPMKELFSMRLVVLCNALPISSLYPFLYFMIRDFHVAKRDEDIGYYAGYVGAALMLGRVFTSVFWGVIADRYGRKPVIIFGIVSVIILNTLFGLSINIWMALATRFLLGLFNGLLGPIKVY
uniref:Major facilitator superfamily (MFS) profile domain-containing protein n=1 Tax=Kalanchoe fedtschenkoi TaxID=63787 RepID=A0A7N0TM52_KALFE